jgi:8-oxo-dGTP pyrophosphatase MutT (NUDIX family)
MSAGVILVDPDGAVLMQLRDDDPAIMFPNHWGLTGGASQDGETPEQTARREVAEETGLVLGHIEPFRAYYFSETGARSGAKRTPSKARADYELYVYHAPCATPAAEMECGEGRELRFFAPDAFASLDVAYNHRDVLTDFFASSAYARYRRGEAFGDATDPIDPLDTFLARLDAGDPWFDALTDAIAGWQRAEETVDGRSYRYLIGGEAFDWLILAERLLAAAGSRIPPADVERLLFEGRPPAGESDDTAGRLSDDRLRELIGEGKHRAHLNYVYGVTVEEALQYAVELEIAKERATIHLKDPRSDEALRDPIYERIYGEQRSALLRDFRDESMRPHAPHISLTELRDFMYWLFKYRVKNQEPARVASDTRKALAQLSAMEAAVRRAHARRSDTTPPPGEDVVEATAR